MLEKRVLGRCPALLIGVLWASSAAAQPAPGQPAPPGAPAAPAAQPPADPPPGDPADLPPEAAPEERPDPLRAALVPVKGGLTVPEVGRMASTTSYSVRARQAELRAAAARVDEAFVQYFPRLTLTASYTRLSPSDNSLGGGGAIVGAANAGPITTGPCPGDPALTCVLDSGGLPVQATQLTFESLENQYSLVASLSVPISDYILRLRQAHRGTKNAVAAKEIEVQATRLTTAADGKVSFFNWQRSRGQVVVATEAVAQARAHVEDSKKAFDAGLISRADVLRLEAQVARAEGLEAEAKAFEVVAEQQLRTQLHLPEGAPLASAVDVFQAPNVPNLPPLEQLIQEAHNNRLELKSLVETERALEESASATRAGYAPRLDAFGNATYANPNQRVFPQQDQWDFTWDVGVRLTWTVNETFSTIGAAANADAQVEQVAEQRGSVRDGIRVEVASAYADVSKSRASIEAATRELEAAEESLRVRRKLFQFGKATSVDLIDAETELTRARLALLGAHIDFLVAEVRLEHATGRDVARASAPPPG